MNAWDCFHRTNEMPLPPTVFWPGEVRRGELAFMVREGIFRDPDAECYVIRGQDDERGDPVIIAGIRPYLTRTPFVAYPVVDMHMLAYYFYRMLFSERNSEIYSPAIDEVYEGIFVKFFNLARGEPL